MISEKHINKNDMKWFTRSCSLICRSSAFTKKTLCFDRNLLCFVSLYLPRNCLVLVTYNKTNIPCLFCLISKLFSLGNIIFNSASRRWILITSGESFLILNKKAWNICLICKTNFQFTQQVFGKTTALSRHHLKWLRLGKQN